MDALERRRKVLQGLVVLVFGLVVAVLGYVVLTGGPDTVQDPSKSLSDPVVRFTNTTVTPDGQLHFKIKTCNNSDKPVALRYTSTLRQADPLGFSVEIGHGVVLRQPGCQTASGVTFLPAAAQDRAKKLLAQGITPHFYFLSVYVPVEGGSTYTVKTNTITVVAK